MTDPIPFPCYGCGREIIEDDAPNLIIGKEPKEFCSICLANASVVSKAGKKWKLSPVVT